MAAERAPNPPSGEQFRAEYLVAASDEPEARARAQDLCLEQTVEFPEELLPEGLIRDQVLGPELLSAGGRGCSFRRHVRAPSRPSLPYPS